jgi:hypothetical protein
MLIQILWEILIRDRLHYGGCAISWKATVQSTIALSTPEAEYMTITESDETIWLKDLLEEISAHDGSTTIFCDSRSAIHLAKNHIYHWRRKHIEVKYHFVRHVISKGIY